ncbi:hypothetical protein [Amycolatopsis cihanbeyliensis]|uniref:Uncharacterized protein n=1 Tax=Amycolatopsis cihanbeyliensis TaxID=1128664 RepID=A0A542DLT1_AMYCI|nr:hypothetical protein [Amycolatopsis cihanbeyliensis]TQJ03935.1 hypothetical protein FB471_3710 [Amycolatopsis cihanbeyliensis]
MAIGVVEVAVVVGYGCAVLLGWIRARTAAQITRERETKRQEIIRSLPLGSRVLDINGAGIMVEVGRQTTPPSQSPTGSEDDLQHS